MSTKDEALALLSEIESAVEGFDRSHAPDRREDLLRKLELLRRWYAVDPRVGTAVTGLEDWLMVLYDPHAWPRLGRPDLLQNAALTRCLELRAALTGGATAVKDSPA